VWFGAGSGFPSPCPRGLVSRVFPISIALSDQSQSINALEANEECSHVCVHRNRTFRPARKWRLLMKKLILAAFTALSLTAAIAPLAGSPHDLYKIVR
jgi:hypothetical protein